MTIGLDVVMDTRHAYNPVTGSEFGMLCYLNSPDKWNDAVQFIDQVLVGSVLPGDANLDGAVNDTDASIVAGNWQLQSGAMWAMGDFNGDQKVNDADAAIMAAHWGGTPGEGGPCPNPRPWRCSWALWPPSPSCGGNAERANLPKRSGNTEEAFSRHHPGVIVGQPNRPIDETRPG